MTDITRVRGDTAADVYLVKDETGAALDISGFSFILTVNTLKNPPDTTTELYSLTGVIISAVDGRVEFVPTLANSDQKPTNYFFDVQMTDSSGRIKTIDSGKYLYKQDKTK